MKVKIFEFLIEDYTTTEMSGFINEWLSKNPEISIVERKQSSSNYHVIISIWYN